MGRNPGSRFVYCHHFEGRTPSLRLAEDGPAPLSPLEARPAPPVCSPRGPPRGGPAQVSLAPAVVGPCRRRQSRRCSVRTAVLMGQAAAAPTASETSLGDGDTRWLTRVPQSHSEKGVLKRQSGPPRTRTSTSTLLKLETTFPKPFLIFI